MPAVVSAAKKVSPATKSVLYYRGIQERGRTDGRNHSRRGLAQPAAGATGGHKGMFGKVMCLCGCVGFTGAPVFASRAAVRTGSGLVYLGVPAAIWQVAAVKSDEAMPFPLPDRDGKLACAGEEEIRRRAAGCDAVSSARPRAQRRERPTRAEPA